MTKLEKLLILHEGEKLKPYRCTAGKLTIGVGRNLDDVGIYKNEAKVMLEKDIEAAVNQLKKYAFYDELDEVRQAAVIDMMFNLGAKRFRNFGKMILALDTKDYEKAGSEALNSAWANQVGERAIRISRMLKSGKWPKEVI